MELNDLKPLIAWLHLHPHWGIIFAFGFAFAESLAFVGLFVPGSVIMTMFGILVGAGILPIASITLFAIIGAFIGDILSYAIGYYYRDRIHTIWPFRNMSNWLSRSEQFFNDHGGKSIFIGRFVGPVRPLLPIIAGSMKMSPLRFLIVDGIAAILWAPIYMLPGFIIGAASLALAPEATTRIVLYLCLILFVIWLCFWVLKRGAEWLVDTIDNGIQRLWQRIQQSRRMKPLAHLLQATHIPEDHTQLLMAFYLLLCVILFIALTIFVSIHGAMDWLNLPVYHLFRSIFNPLMQKIMLAITLIGEPRGLVLLWLVVFAYLAYKRNWHAALHWLSIGFLAIGVAGVFKRGFDSPRPSGLILGPTSWSYPSGHVTLSAAFFGFLAILLCKDSQTIKRKLGIAIVCLLVLLIAVSRLYLGLHWFTDIIAGLLLGSAIVLGVGISYCREPTANPSIKELLGVSIIVVIITWSLFMFVEFKQKIYDYTPAWPQQTIQFKQWWQQGINDAPIFRENRFGYVVQTMNIEWYAQPKVIAAQLEKLGWLKKPKTYLISTLQYLGSKDKSQLLPPLPVVYRDRKPVLVMTKLVSRNKPIVILRLWRSDVIIAPEMKPLYVGTIGYRRPFTHHFQHFLHADKKNGVILGSAMAFLMANISAYPHKILTYPEQKPLNKREDYDWDGRVLLVSP